MAEQEADDKLEASRAARRRENGEHLLRDADNLWQKRQKSSNGASRGHKMSKEESRYNRGLLKEVGKIKKEGQFDGLLERCVDKKVTVLH